MKILSTLKEIVSSTLDGWAFEFETEKMFNARADGLPFPLVFFEEYTDGSIVRKYGWVERTTVELSFMKLAPFGCSAEEREKLREEIKSEGVMPFIKALDEAQVFSVIDSYTILAEPPRFDENAVSVLLRFTAEAPICCL